MQGDFSNTAIVTIIVQPINDPPSVTTSKDNLVDVENDPAAAIDAGLALADLDSDRFAAAPPCGSPATTTTAETCSALSIGFALRQASTPAGAAP